MTKVLMIINPNPSRGEKPSAFLTLGKFPYGPHSACTTTSFGIMQNIVRPSENAPGSGLTSIRIRLFIKSFQTPNQCDGPT